jgi:hypothetical protein
MKRVLLTEFFTFSNESRNDEIRFVLDKNVKSGLFDEIVLLSEKDQGPLSTVITGKRITYKYAFEYANENFEPGTLIVISNADIYFDESLKSLSLDANTCVALTRYNDGVLDPGLSCTQDSWMFLVPIKIPPKCDFYFGVMGCDNYIARLLKNEGYRVMNPALDVKSHHVHTTQYRTYVPKPIKPRDHYHFVDPGTLRQREPSSFCTIATIGCVDEFVAHVCSLYRWHPTKPVYAMVDTETMERVTKCLPFLKNLKMYPKLDQYSGKNRAQMEREGTWTQFQMLKATVMKCALLKESDVMYLDSDILVTEVLHIDPDFELGLSPHYIKKSDTDKFGFYNGGMIWTSNARVCDDWILASKTSRFFDQAALEELPKKYRHFDFGEDYNISWWRVSQSDETYQQMTQYFDINGARFKNKQIKCVHTHFADKQYAYFNNFIVNLFVASNKWVELILIERIMNKKWVLLRPKQPLPFPNQHTNDSFRELMPMMARDDVVCLDAEGITIPRLGQFVCLYDRDTNEWLSEEVRQSLKVFVGNMDVEQEFGNDPRFSPWIYWTRHPKIIEGVTPPEVRDIESIFIGNIENSVQKARRSDAWKDVIQVFHLTESHSKKFTQQEYLGLMARSKYGLSLMGFGIKCHREIELLALGTVPLIVEGISTRSYQEPLIEGVHFFRIRGPDDVTRIVRETSDEQWRHMSRAGQEWFRRNVHSEKAWHTFLERILKD